MSVPAAPRTILVHARDNVAIVANEGGLAAGTTLAGGQVLRDPVPEGHKVALTDIGEGEAVRRYGVVIGRATRPVAAGEHVHEGLMTAPCAPSLEGLARAPGKPSPGEPLVGHTFEGYRNADGSVGTRNVLAITTTVQCVAGVVDAALARIRTELLPRYPNVDDVISLEHVYGCGVAIDAPDAVIPIRTLRHLASNPNFGGEILLVSLGCEKLQPERLMAAGSAPLLPIGELDRDDPDRGAGFDVVSLQSPELGGFESMLAAILRAAERHLARLDARRRETVPASELVVGLQCGGSDAFSGVTANPALGHCADLLVRAGATVMFGEATEVRDGIDQLVARAADDTVARDLVREMAWFDAYLARGGVDRGANTTPGNRRGGLSNIVEKAMGSIVKSGSAPIAAVLPPGEKLASRGLVYASTPASDFVCGTLQLAAGMTVHVFTTGRGTPYGLPGCPVVKVATRTALARRWHDLMDVNAGRIADGEASIEELGQELFERLLEVASGRPTWTERWGLKNALALFNPAPLT